MVELRAEHANLHTIPKTLPGKLLKLLARTPQNVDLNHVRKSWRSPEHDAFYHAETFLQNTADRLVGFSSSTQICLCFLDPSFFSSFQQPGETTYTHCGTVLKRFRINVGNLTEWRRVIIQDAERGKTRGHRARMVIKTEKRERAERNFGKRRNQGRGAQVWIRGARCPSMVLRASHT